MTSLLNYFSVERSDIHVRGAEGFWCSGAYGRYGAPALVNHIDRLESYELVTRSRTDLQDRRGVVLYLTAYGHALLLTSREESQA